ncbi:MAG: TIGR00730 family Rossman fold protein [Deltaproteobacteria bacterium]|nr:MAG: TIGR00730 family Rossman fold protein [Deltaproteobacteria bacterium]
MRNFRRLAVYCGSSVGQRVAYRDAAEALGRTLAERDITLVFGAGRVGLMGAIADAVLDAGGEAYGVIPEKLMDLELAHPNLTELYVVQGMHPRKLLMGQLADGFIAMPGGYGTFEELFEVITWTQLNYHLKPVGLLNVDGYYDKLIDFLDHARDEGFVRGIHRDMLVADADPAALIDKLAAVHVPELGQWIDQV